MTIGGCFYLNFTNTENLKNGTAKSKTLSDQIRQLEEYCKDNNIGVFEGRVEDEDSSLFFQIKSQDMNLVQYLLTLKLAGVKIVTLTKQVNSFEIDEDVENYKSTLKGDELSDYQRAVKIVNNTRGEIAFFELNFFYSHVKYQYKQYADWIDFYTAAYEAYNIDEDDEDFNDGLKDSEIEEYAHKIIQDSKYAASKDRISRHRLAMSHKSIEDVDNQMDRYKIANKAESIFVDEIQPKLDEELSAKIKELKEKGFKKNAVKGKLKISDTILNRHWY